MTAGRRIHQVMSLSTELHGLVRGGGGRHRHEHGHRTNHYGLGSCTFSNKGKIEREICSFSHASGMGRFDLIWPILFFGSRRRQF